MAKKSKVNSKKINHKNVLYVIGAVIVIVLLFTLVLKYTGKELAGKAVEIAQSTDEGGNKILPAIITISEQDLADIFVGGVRTAEFGFNGKTYVLTIGKLSDGSLGGQEVNILGESNEPEIPGMTELPDLIVENAQYVETTSQGKLHYSITLKNQGKGTLLVPLYADEMTDSFITTATLYDNTNNELGLEENWHNEEGQFELVADTSYTYDVYFENIIINPNTLNLIVKTDTLGVVSESDETNNEYSSNPIQQQEEPELPDLTISSVQTTPNADGTYTLTYSIINNGGVSQSTYLYLEDWFDGNTYLTEEPYVKPLSTGETTTIDHIVDLLSYEGFTWVAEVDKSTDQTVVPIKESDEQNNRLTGCLAGKSCYDLVSQQQGTCNNDGTVCTLPKIDLVLDEVGQLNNIIENGNVLTDFEIRICINNVPDNIQFTPFNVHVLSYISDDFNSDNLYDENTFTVSADVISQIVSSPNGCLDVGYLFEQVEVMGQLLPIIPMEVRVDDEPAQIDESDENNNNDQLIITQTT